MASGKEGIVTWWSVLVECAAPEGAAPLDPEDNRADALVDAVVEHDGVSTLGADRYDVRLSIEGDDVLAVGVRARELVWKAVANAGLPEWPVVRLDVMTHGDLELELSRPTLPALAGVTEVADRLGVSRQRLAELRTRPGFPSPFVELAATPVWLVDAIDSWAEGWDRRPGRRHQESMVE